MLKRLVVLSHSELPYVLLLSAPLCQYDVHDTFSYFMDYSTLSYSTVAGAAVVMICAAY